MTTPRLDRGAIRNHARLLIIREAASIRRSDGRTIAETLEDLRPTFYLELPPNKRYRCALLIAREVLPGAHWLEEVVSATLEYWSSEDCSPAHRQKLALPHSTDFPGSLVVRPSDLNAHCQYLDEEEAEFFERQADRHHQPDYPPRPAPPDLSRARRRLSQTDARLLAEYQFGGSSLPTLAAQDGRSKQTIYKAIRRAAEIAAITFRNRPPGGRPVKG